MPCSDSWRSRHDRTSQPGGGARRAWRHAQAASSDQRFVGRAFPDAFAYSVNADLYRLILDLESAGTPIDIITLAEAKEFLCDDTRTMAYVGEILTNIVSVANAKEYARIVRERAISRQIVDVASGIEEVAHQNCSIEDKIAQAQALVLGLDAGGTTGECQMVGDILRDHVEVLQERHDRAQKGDMLDGLSTGIPDLDQYTQGLKSGQMIVIAGRPAMGKTTLAMNIAADVAIKQGRPVLVVSLEMTKAQLMDRLIAAVGGISAKPERWFLHSQRLHRAQRGSPQAPGRKDRRERRACNDDATHTVHRPPTEASHGRPGADRHRLPRTRRGRWQGSCR